VSMLRKREDLNKELLDGFLEKRGFGVITPDFYESCNKVFDGVDKDRIVFQCKCGQVGILSKEMADVAIGKFGESIPCKDCGLNSVLPGNLRIDFKKLHNLKKVESILQTITDLSQGIIQSKLDEINRIDPALINATHPQELFYQMFQFANTLKSINESDSQMSQAISELIEKAMVCYSEFVKVFQYPFVDTKEMRNTTLTELHAEQFKLFREKLKFRGLFDETELDQSASQEELELNIKLNAYNHLIEEKRILETIFNLVKIADGNGYMQNPFKGEMVVNNGKNKKVSSLADMILAFVSYPSGYPVHILLSDIYKTRLRNAHAHNNYELLMDRGKIQYKDSLDINDFFKIVDGVKEFHLLIQLGLSKAFYCFYPVVRNVILGYDDPSIERGRLIPATPETLAEIRVEGYSFNEKNILDPVLSLEDGRLFIKTSVSIDFYFLSDESTSLWLKQVLQTNGRVVVSFHNILMFDPKNKINGRIILTFDSKYFKKTISLPSDFLDELKKYGVS
jgi:hypothetical protein